MKKEWILKMLCFCGCIWVCLFLLASQSKGQSSYNPYSYQQTYNPFGYGYGYGYQQPYIPYGYDYQKPYNPYVPYNPYEDGYTPYLDDDYEPPPDWSNWIWTDPWTAHDPSGEGVVNVDWQPEYIGTSPYFRQTGYNPYNLNMPYNYGWNQPYNYEWGRPYFGGYHQSFDPYSLGYQQPPLYVTPSFNGNEYRDPYPSPWGSFGPGVMYVGYPPPTPELSFLLI